MNKHTENAVKEKRKEGGIPTNAEGHQKIAKVKKQVEFEGKKLQAITQKNSQLKDEVFLFSFFFFLFFSS